MDIRGRKKAEVNTCTYPPPPPCEHAPCQSSKGTLVTPTPHPLSNMKFQGLPIIILVVIFLGQAAAFLLMCTHLVLYLSIQFTRRNNRTHIMYKTSFFHLGHMNFRGKRNFAKTFPFTVCKEEGSVFGQIRAQMMKMMASY